MWNTQSIRETITDRKTRNYTRCCRSTPNSIAFSESVPFLWFHASLLAFPLKSRIPRRSVFTSPTVACLNSAYSSSKSSSAGVLFKCFTSSASLSKSSCKPRRRPARFTARFASVIAESMQTRYSAHSESYDYRYVAVCVWHGVCVRARLQYWQIYDMHCLCSVTANVRRSVSVTVYTHGADLHSRCTSTCTRTSAAAHFSPAHHAQLLLLWLLFACSAGFTSDTL